MGKRTRKRFGQHFLVDGNVCRRIVTTVNLAPPDVVLEIGPGRGALTGVLLETGVRVLAVEVDAELVDRLTARFVDEIQSGQLILVTGDILRVDLEALCRQARPDGPLRVFGNLPYHIATAVIQRLIEYRTHFSDMTLMLQREVAERILSPPGNKQYGYLSVVVQYHCEGKKLFHVHPGVFRPIPKVMSTVVHLCFRPQPAVSVEDETFFFQLVSALFAERRKTVLNNLKRVARRFRFIDPEKSLRDAHIDPTRRAETLSLEELARLADQLYQSGP